MLAKSCLRHSRIARVPCNIDVTEAIDSYASPNTDRFTDIDLDVPRPENMTPQPTKSASLGYVGPMVCVALTQTG